MHIPSDDERLKETQKVADAMWNSAVNLHASYDAISYAAASIIATVIMQAPRDPATSEEDVIVAIAKHIKEAIKLSKETIQ